MTSKNRTNHLLSAHLSLPQDRTVQTPLYCTNLPIKPHPSLAHEQDPEIPELLHLGQDLFLNPEKALHHFPADLNFCLKTFGLNCIGMSCFWRILLNFSQNSRNIQDRNAVMFLSILFFLGVSFSRGFGASQPQKQQLEITNFRKQKQNRSDRRYLLFCPMPKLHPPTSPLRKKEPSHL